MRELEGKITVLTGASSGIGAVAAQRLASEGAIVINIFRLPGTDMNESMRYNSLMEKMLLAKFPDEIEYVWARCGSAERIIRSGSYSCGLCRVRCGGADLEGRGGDDHRQDRNGPRREVQLAPVDRRPDEAARP